MRKVPRQPSTERGFYEAYADFAKTVRTWFIAFGAGVPVLFLSNREMWTRLEAGHQVRAFILCFLGGVAIQVLVALLFRTAMWYLYLEEIEVITDQTRRYRYAAWLSQGYWLEALADLGTLALFSKATFTVLRFLWV